MCNRSFDEDEYLLLSGIQHFAFCPRQWGLIHLEDQWSENFLTTMGKILHEKTDDPFLKERRGDKIITRAMLLSSSQLKVAGQADTVEFHLQMGKAIGVQLEGCEGLWLARPVEYKRGKPKISDCDRLQLCAQAICLEEMLGEPIHEGYLFYWETRRREKVAFDSVLRDETGKICREMWNAYSNQKTPVAKKGKQCRACSLSGLCLVGAVGGNDKTGQYLARMMED